MHGKDLASAGNYQIMPDWMTGFLPSFNFYVDRQADFNY